MPRDPAKLEVFHLGHQLVLDLYPLTRVLPASERFGLQAQIRRAACSVPTNIVEGCARTSAREYARFLGMALGSAAEVGYLLRLAGDLGLLSGPELLRCKKSSEHVARALQKLQQAASGFE